MFILRARRLSSKLLKQGYLGECLKSSFRKFYGQYGDLIEQYAVSLSRMLNDPWPVTVTVQTIGLSTNVMTTWPSLTFNELRVVFIEHLQQVWHGSRERLTFRTLVSFPFLWTCLFSNYWDQFSPTCRVFFRLFTLNITGYFLEFY